MSKKTIPVPAKLVSMNWADLVQAHPFECNALVALCRVTAAAEEVADQEALRANKLEQQACTATRAEKDALERAQQLEARLEATRKAAAASLDQKDQLFRAEAAEKLQAQQALVAAKDDSRLFKSACLLAAVVGLLVCSGTYFFYRTSAALVQRAAERRIKDLELDRDVLAKDCAKKKVVVPPKKKVVKKKPRRPVPPPPF